MSERIPHADFPTDETLAAFIDGKLEPEMRPRVVEHIATCPECYDVVLGAQELRGQATPGNVVPFRRPGLRVVALAAAAAAVVIAFFTTPIRERILLHPKSGLAALADAAPPQRNIEGRLSGFPYRPMKPVMRGKKGEDHSPERIRLLTVAAQVAAEAEKNPTPENLHASGIALLMLGDSDAAVDDLEKALRKETGEDEIAKAVQKATDAALMNDLAVALREAAPGVGRLLATDVSERAWTLQPTSTTAWNRALGFEAMNARSDAIRAWNDFLKIEDPGSKWAREARSHIVRLSQPTDSELWRRFRPRAVTLIVESIRRFPQQTRALIDEDLFPAWANAVVLGDERRAASELAILAKAGDEMRRHSRDSLVLEEVQTIRRGNPQQRHELATAHLAYAHARGLYKQDRIDAALEDYVRSRSTFAANGAPYEELAVIGVASCHYVHASYERTIADLGPVRQDAAGHRSATAMAEWVTGLALTQLGHPVEALRRYRSAREHFEAIGEKENLALIDTLSAQAYESLGQLREAWIARSEALRLAQDVPESRLFHNVITEAAMSAGRIGAFHAALAFLNTSVDRDERIGDKIGIVTSLRWRAAVRALLGNRNGAEADLRRARQVLPLIEDAGLRRDAAAGLDLADSIASATSASALRSLDSAREYATGTHTYFQIADITAYRVALLAKQEPARAIREAVDGIDGLESRLDNSDDPSLAVSPLVYVPLRRLYDAALRLAVDRGDAVQAFELSQRARACTLRFNGRPSTFKAGASAWTKMPEGTALLSYLVLDRDLLSWSVSRGRLRMNIARGVAPRVRLEIAALREAIAHEDNRALVDAQRLYEVLIRPHEEQLLFNERLQILADAELWNVPFAFLRAHSTDPFLVEKYELAISATADASGDAPPSGGQRPSVVIFGDAAGGRDWTKLVGAGHEVRSVAKEFNDIHVMSSSASLAMVAGECERADIIHFAGHAEQVPDRPNLSSLVIGAGDDGTRLSAGDIRRLRLRRHPSVVLAACSTATSTSGHFESIGTLADAFAYAGARTVIGTLWDVVDGDAADFFELYYVELHRSSTPSAALRAAQRAWIRENRSAGVWAAVECLSSRIFVS